MNLAAIDIGSNAARLLIAQAKPYHDGTVDFTKLTLLRVPLRLGMDVFATGEISPAREEMMLKTMQAYQLLMQIYEVKGVKACATSAMREAANGAEIIQRIAAHTGINIRILSGEDEAGVIFETHIAEKLNPAKSYVYVDVGGGSTEFTLFAKGKIRHKQSFNIGTIRLLKDQVTKGEWDAAKAAIKQAVKNEGPLMAIGSGGNINRIFSISKTKDDQPMSYTRLRSYYTQLSALSMEERAHRYQLREDRADVIVPALEIYLAIMRWSGATEIFAPRIGLADGLIRMLYQEMTEQG